MRGSPTDSTHGKTKSGGSFTARRDFNRWMRGGPTELADGGIKSDDSFAVAVRLERVDAWKPRGHYTRYDQNATTVSQLAACSSRWARGCPTELEGGVTRGDDSQCVTDS